MIPSRNVATLLGLSAIVVIAYLLRVVQAPGGRMLADWRPVPTLVQPQIYPPVSLPPGERS